MEWILEQGFRKVPNKNRKRVLGIMQWNIKALWQLFFLRGGGQRDQAANDFLFVFIVCLFQNHMFFFNFKNSHLYTNHSDDAFVDANYVFLM